MEGIRRLSRNAPARPGRRPGGTSEASNQTGVSVWPSLHMQLPTSAYGSSRHSSAPGSTPQTTSSTCGSCDSSTISQTRSRYGPHTSPGHTRSLPRRHELRPASSPWGQEEAVQELRDHALNIPAYNALASWERERALVERYAQRVGPQAHTEPPRHSAPRTVAMVGLENSHHYQVSTTPRPLARRLSLEAADSMIPRDMDLQDDATPTGQPPDPLTTNMSGRAGTWHLASALYCLLRTAQRRWQHIRKCSATWSLHQDGWKQAEVVPPHERENPPTTENPSQILAIHHIWALAAA